MSHHKHSTYDQHTSWVKDIIRTMESNHTAYIYGPEQKRTMECIALELGYEIDYVALHKTKYEQKYWSIRRIK